MRPSGFFVLRSSLLPLDALRAFRTRDDLRKWLDDPAVREAIFLASPSLEESLPFFLGEPESERAEKVEHSLVKYFSRLTTRATPFGLFAGVAVGTLGEKTKLRLAPRNENA